MSFRHFLARPIVKVGDNVVWVDSSSWHAHQHKVIFHIDAVFRHNIPVSAVAALAYDMYVLTGTKMYAQKLGVWSTSSGPVTVVYYYADTVGGGFPTVIEQDVKDYVDSHQKQRTRK